MLKAKHWVEGRILNIDQLLHSMVDHSLDLHEMFLHITGRHS